MEEAGRESKGSGAGASASTICTVRTPDGTVGAAVVDDEAPPSSEKAHQVRHEKHGRLRVHSDAWQAIGSGKEVMYPLFRVMNGKGGGAYSS